jgi:hypothetical protein
MSSSSAGRSVMVILDEYDAGRVVKLLFGLNSEKNDVFTDGVVVE